MRIALHVLAGFFEEPLLPGEFVELTQRRKILQPLQAEDFEETPSRRVHHRSTGNFSLARDPDQMTLEKTLYRRPGIDTRRT